MKFTVLRQTFEETLHRAGNFTSYRLGDIESLRGVYINAKADGVVLHTTNITDYYRGDFGGKVEKEGVVLVDHKTLLEVIKSVDDTTILVEKEQNSLSINTKNGKVHIACLDETTFPLVDINGNGKAEDILLKNLFPKNLSFVLLSAATDETRPVLTGVYYDFKEKKQDVVSTDGFRLSLLSTKKKESPFLGSFIVPARSLTTLIRSFGSAIKKTSIDKQTKKLFWSGEGFFIQTRTLDGEFPPYEKVIPQAGSTDVLFKAKELLRALKTVALFSKEGSSMVQVAIKEGALNVSSQKSTQGEAQLSVPLLKKEGIDNSITFNYRYLQAFLAEAGDSTVQFEMTEPSLPGVFRVVENEELLHIIMPIRPQE